MTRHDDTAPLRDMFEYALTAQRFIEKRMREDLDSDVMLRLALTRAIEVIGESASRVSPKFKAANPNIQWTQIIATRHRLIHGYDLIDLNILWDISTLDLPELITQLRPLVGEMGGTK
jgi:uncharacterized protein with HEPN domain